LLTKTSKLEKNFKLVENLILVELDTVREPGIGSGLCLVIVFIVILVEIFA